MSIGVKQSVGTLVIQTACLYWFGDGSLELKLMAKRYEAVTSGYGPASLNRLATSCPVRLSFFISPS